MKNSDMSAFKKWSLIMGIAALGISGLVVFATYMDVSHNSWQRQGTVRAILVGSSLAIMFLVYAALCFRAFRMPSMINIGIIYGIQSVLFFVLMVLVWVIIFLPAY